MDFTLPLTQAQLDELGKSIAVTCKGDRDIIATLFIIALSESDCHPASRQVRKLFELPIEGILDQKWLDKFSASLAH